MYSHFFGPGLYHKAQCPGFLSNESRTPVLGMWRTLTAHAFLCLKCSTLYILTDISYFLRAAAVKAARPGIHAPFCDLSVSWNVNRENAQKDHETAKRRKPRSMTRSGVPRNAAHQGRKVYPGSDGTQLWTPGSWSTVHCSVSNPGVIGPNRRTNEQR